MIQTNPFHDSVRLSAIPDELEEITSSVTVFNPAPVHCLHALRLCLTQYSVSGRGRHHHVSGLWSACKRVWRCPGQDWTLRTGSRPPPKRHSSIQSRAVRGILQWARQLTWSFSLPFKARERLYICNVMLCFICIHQTGGSSNTNACSCIVRRLSASVHHRHLISLCADGSPLECKTSLEQSTEESAWNGVWTG